MARNVLDRWYCGVLGSWASPSRIPPYARYAADHPPDREPAARPRTRAEGGGESCRFPARSGFERGDKPALAVEAGGYERATEPTARVDRSGVRPLKDPGVTPVVASHHPAETGVRFGQAGESAGVPPKTVALRAQGAGWIDPGMHQQ